MPAFKTSASPRACSAPRHVGHGVTEGDGTPFAVSPPLPAIHGAERVRAARGDDGPREQTLADWARERVLDGLLALRGGSDLRRKHSRSGAARLERCFGCLQLRLEVVAPLLLGVHPQRVVVVTVCAVFSSDRVHDERVRVWLLDGHASRR